MLTLKDYYTGQLYLIRALHDPGLPDEHRRCYTRAIDHAAKKIRELKRIEGCVLPLDDLDDCG